ncbi:MAG: dockerin type I domain-containing protein [Phycisphaerae bacterium]
MSRSLLRECRCAERNRNRFRRQSTICGRAGYAGLPDHTRQLWNILIIDIGAFEHTLAALAGDVNCDGVVDINDSPVFVGVLLGMDADPCHMAAADMNGDTSADGGDIQMFVQALIVP